jgi:hypothetical protein
MAEASSMATSPACLGPILSLHRQPGVVWRSLPLIAGVPLVTGIALRLHLASPPVTRFSSPS